MPGKRITDQQRKLYMKARSKGKTQIVAAAQAGFSERSARNIQKPDYNNKKPRHWKTRKDLFEGVWDKIIVPKLERFPNLQAPSILLDLQDNYPDQFPDSCLRTLHRRVRKWKSLHGPEKEIIFRQNHPPGEQGISDFTVADKLNVTIRNQPFPHRLYQFRLSCSGWKYGQVILGGESYPALAENLQNALWSLGGVPCTHRTDSLSAAFKNLSSKEKKDLTKAYEELCIHYGMEATRNNKGVSHENGSIESPNRHLKNSLDQALMLRGSRDFNSVEEYKQFVQEVIRKQNQRIQKIVNEERQYLNLLPDTKACDYQECRLGVSTSSTIRVKGIGYSVPSRLIGHTLKIHLYDDRLECFVGGDHVITLQRKRSKNRNPNHINYRHVIGSLSKKPQAFRAYIYREHLFPTLAFHQAWKVLDEHLDPRKACREYVAILKDAADNSEEEVNRYLENCIHKNKLPNSVEVKKLFRGEERHIPEQKLQEVDISSYDQLITGGVL